MEEINYNDLYCGISIAEIKSYYFYYGDSNLHLEIKYDNKTMDRKIKEGCEVYVKQTFLKCLEYCMDKNYPFINFFEDGQYGIYDIKVTFKKKKTK